MPKSIENELVRRVCGHRLATTVTNLKTFSIFSVLVFVLFFFHMKSNYFSAYLIKYFIWLRHNVALHKNASEKTYTHNTHAM